MSVAVVGLSYFGAGAAGCGGIKNPQYSGVYSLNIEKTQFLEQDFQGVKTPNEDLKKRASLLLPVNLNVLQRMKYEGGNFIHFLQFNGSAENPWNLVLDLPSLVHKAYGAALNEQDPDLDGAKLPTEDGQSYGSDECKTYYYYNVALVSDVVKNHLSGEYSQDASGVADGLMTQPSPLAFVATSNHPEMQIYQAKKQVGTDWVTLNKGDQKEPPVNQGLVTDWSNALNTNNGMTLVLSIKRTAYTKGGHCGKIAQGTLPPSDGTQEIIAVYDSTDFPGMQNDDGIVTGSQSDLIALPGGSLFSAPHFFHD